MNTEQKAKQTAKRTAAVSADWKRLWLAAQEMHQHITNQADLSRFLNVSQQDITNWKSRGLPQDRIIPLAQQIGCRAEWLATGDGDMVGSQLDKLFSAMPCSVRQSTLDFIQFQLSGDAHRLVAGEQLASYNAWIEAIRADLEKRRKCSR